MTGKTDYIIDYLLKQDKGMEWELKQNDPKRKPRRLTQNAYYWVLVGKLAQATGISSAEIHNRNLRDLGLVERTNEGDLITVVLPDTVRAEKDALEATMFHIKPTSKVIKGKRRRNLRVYVLLRGSSTFNVSEFSALVDLAVQDAQTECIETIPPDELAHIRELELQHEKVREMEKEYEERQKQKRLTPRPD